MRALLLLLLPTATEAVRVHNVPRGAEDAPHDAHDGTIVQWEQGGLHWRYAMAYTNCTMNGGSRRWAYG